MPPPPSPLPTWYLLLRRHVTDRPTIIKQCQATEKAQAAELFADRLNRLGADDLYTAPELLGAIKRADELTEEEQRWIQLEDPILLAL